MLIILTLVVTWIARNWWKILLLLIGLIIVHEYQLKKQSGKAGTETVPEEDAADEGGGGTEPDAENENENEET